MKVETSGHESRITVDIAAPPARVWQVMSDVERWPEWTASVSSVRRLGSRGPLGRGARVLIKQPRFPHALWKVVEIQPDRGFTWESRAPGIGVTASHSVAPAPGGGTRATLVLRYQGPIGRWLDRRTRRLTATYLEMEARGLKERSERRATA